jgi:hypothetical protein
VHFNGTPGAFDLPAASPNGNVSLSIVPRTVDANPGRYDLDVLASSMGASSRSYWMHIDDVPTTPGTYDLATLGAKACYCPDAAPVGDYTGDAVGSSWGAFGGATDACSRTDGTPQTDIAPACESLSGSLTIASFVADCVRPGEMNEAGADCLLAFDATVDVPKSAGSVYLHVHDVQDDRMTHSTCDVQHSSGLDLGIGYIPN